MTNPPKKFQEVSIERAHEIAAELENRSIEETSSMKVFTGKHPELGEVHVVIPPLGNSLLLPVVLQSF